MILRPYDRQVSNSVAKDIWCKMETHNPINILHPLAIDISITKSLIIWQLRKCWQTYVFVVYLHTYMWMYFTGVCMELSARICNASTITWISYKWLFPHLCNLKVIDNHLVNWGLYGFVCINIPNVNPVIWDVSEAYFVDTLNWLRPRDTCMRQWNKISLLQTMACRLIGAKPLSEPTLVYCQSGPWE